MKNIYNYSLIIIDIIFLYLNKCFYFIMYIRCYYLKLFKIIGLNLIEIGENNGFL